MPSAVARCVLPVPGAADQHDILRLLGEGGRGEARDLPAVDLRLLEIEAGQIAMHREARDVHLVADGARRAIRGFGLHQLRQQRRGRRHRGLALLEAFGVAGGHAVQPQLFEVGDQISHGSPPPRAACRSGADRPAARS